MQVQRDSVVLAYDFDRLTPDGLLYDYSKYGLHATPGAGAAAPTRQLDGSYSFDGGDNFALSGASQARFYANAPTGELTILVVATMSAAAQCAWFSCMGLSAPNYFGIQLSHVSPTAYMKQLRGSAAIIYEATTAPQLLVQPLRNVFCMTMEATPRCMVRGTVQSCAWAGGVMATTVYDAAVVPKIGNADVGAAGLVGAMSYLCLLRGAVSSSDMAELSALMQNGVKPFCWRP